MRKNKSATKPITCGRRIAGIFESEDVAKKSCPVSHRTIDQYGGTKCGPSFSIVNPDVIECVWTGEFNLKTLRVDGEIFESEKKRCGLKNIQKLVDKRSIIAFYQIWRL